MCERERESEIEREDLDQLPADLDARRGAFQLFKRDGHFPDAADPVRQLQLHLVQCCV